MFMTTDKLAGADLQASERSRPSYKGHPVLEHVVTRFVALGGQITGKTWGDFVRALRGESRETARRRRIEGAIHYLKCIGVIEYSEVRSPRGEIISRTLKLVA